MTSYNNEQTCELIEITKVNQQVSVVGTVLNISKANRD